jgi:nitrogen fixation/metabolism regulation signal transduction histidine kinase
MSLSLLISFACLTPLTLIVGVNITFKIVGPLRKFENFLNEITEGKAPEDCRLRKDDDLQELRQALNEATAPLRRDKKPETVTSEEERAAA